MRLDSRQSNQRLRPIFASRYLGSFLSRALELRAGSRTYSRSEIPAEITPPRLGGDDLVDRRVRQAVFRALASLRSRAKRDDPVERARKCAGIEFDSKKDSRWSGYCHGPRAAQVKNETRM